MSEVHPFSGATCWVSAGRQWKAVQYNEGDVWHARLRLGVYRFPGQGATATAALDAALHEAEEVGARLVRALPS